MLGAGASREEDSPSAGNRFDFAFSIEPNGFDQNRRSSRKESTEQYRIEPNRTYIVGTQTDNIL